MENLSFCTFVRERYSGKKSHFGPVRHALAKKGHHLISDVWSYVRDALAKGHHLISNVMSYVRNAQVTGHYLISNV